MPEPLCPTPLTVLVSLRDTSPQPASNTLDVPWVVPPGGHRNVGGTGPAGWSPSCPQHQGNSAFLHPSWPRSACFPPEPSPHDDLFGHWSMWQLQQVRAPRARKKDILILTNRTVVVTRGCTAIPGDSSARAKESRRSWDTHTHTRIFLCLPRVFPVFKHPNNPGQRSSPRAPWMGLEARRSRAQLRGPPVPEVSWGAAPQGHPGDVGFRLSQSCQAF